MAVPFLTVAEASELWGLSPQRIRRYCHEERIRAQKISGVWIIEQHTKPVRRHGRNAQAVARALRSVQQ
jgi:hypothetical protein